MSDRTCSWAHLSLIVPLDTVSRLHTQKSYVPSVSGGSFCLVTETENEGQARVVYPNPSDGRFFVHVPEAASIAVYNLQQQELQRLEAPVSDATEITINGPPAIYIVKIVTNGKCVVHKVLVR